MNLSGRTLGYPGMATMWGCFKGMIRRDGVLVSLTEEPTMTTCIPALALSDCMAALNADGKSEASTVEVLDSSCIC